MKSLTGVALIAVSQAGKQNFPEFDKQHSHCQMDYKFKNASCDDVYQNILDELDLWNTGVGPQTKSLNTYHMHEKSQSDYIWIHHDNPIQYMGFGEIFEFTQNKKDCEVVAKSRATGYSFNDWYQDYCNLWTVLRGVGASGRLHHSECLQVPLHP